MSRADRSDWYVTVGFVVFLALLAFGAVFLPCEYLVWMSVSDVPSRCLGEAIHREAPR